MPDAQDQSRRAGGTEVSTPAAKEWYRLNRYELRHLAGHLLARRRDWDARRVALNLDYCAATCLTLGLPALLRVMGEIEGADLAEPATRDLAATFSRLLRRESTLLDRRIKAGSHAGLVNHLVVTAERAPDRLVADQLSWRYDRVDQEGWLDLIATRGQTAVLATRFMMSPNRTHDAWDATYSGGPVGATATFGVDPRRKHLFGEAISWNFNDYDHYYPSTYYWRIWDLATGVLLDEATKYAGDLTPNQLRPAAFRNAELICPWETHDIKRNSIQDPAIERAHAGMLAAEPPEPHTVSDRHQRQQSDSTAEDAGSTERRVTEVTLTCANGPERIVRQERGDGAWGWVLENPVEGSDTLVSLPDGVSMDLMVRLDGELVILGTLKQNIYRFEVDAYHGRAIEPPVRELGSATAEYGISWREGDELNTYEPDERQVVSVPLATGTSGHMYELPQLGAGITPQDFRESTRTSPTGRYLFAKWKLHVDWYDATSHETLGHLAAKDQFSGGGGLLQAWDVSPDDERVVAAANGRWLKVWNLDEAGAFSNRGPGGRRLRLPDWEVGAAAVDADIQHLAFLWGGWLLAAVTEDHELMISRFWHSGGVLARVGLEQEIEEIAVEPYGDVVACLGAAGTLSLYRFRYSPADDVTTLDGSRLTIRYREEAAETVELAGTFTDWEPTAMARDEAGVWSSEAILWDGTHELKLRVDGHDWRLDPHIPFRPGPVGMNNYVVVRPSPADC